VGDHDSPPGSLRHVTGLNALCDGTDLVDLEQKSITEFHIDTCLNSCWVGNKEIITNNLNLVTHKLGHIHIGIEIILVEWVLDGHNWEVVAKILVESDSLLLVQDSIVLASLFTEVVSLVHWVEEFRSGDIESNLDIFFMS
jgi:hypothetical protein